MQNPLADSDASSASSAGVSFTILQAQHGGADLL